MTTTPLALVTGASSGIGTELARGLAASGHRLLLVARREDRLREAAAALPPSPDGEPHLVQTADLAAPDGAARLADAVAERGLEPAVLVNDAGFGVAGDFAEQPLQVQLDMVQVNATALMELTHRLLPTLLEQPDPGVLNVASTAAFVPGPHFAVYYASKAFVLSFSEALHEELRGRARVTCLCPGATRTEFAEVAGMESSRLFRIGAADAATVARRGLRAFRRGRAVCIPTVKDWLMIESVRFSPRFLVRRLTGWLDRRD